MLRPAMEMGVGVAAAASVCSVAYFTKAMIGIYILFVCLFVASMENLNNLHLESKVETLLNGCKMGWEMFGSKCWH